MKRNIEVELEKWKNKTNRKPLILWGARQVGKTYSLKKFGCQHFSNTVYISFYNNNRISAIFDQDYSTERIISALEIELHAQINAKSTLIIFDEVQNAPRVIESLKYFQEEAGQYYICAAGSLLGVSIHAGVSFPVGKVDEMQLFPLNFYEFLHALSEERLASFIGDYTNKELSDFSEKYSELLKIYFAVGGLPGVVNAYRQNYSLDDARQEQINILSQYEGDFGKHVSANELPRIRMVWNSLPAQFAKDNKKFFYGQIKKGARAKEFEIALQWLIDAGLLYKINRVNKPALPLKAYEVFSAFKIYMIDIGLMCALAELNIDAIVYNYKELAEFRGAVAEQFVLQETVAANKHKLYYYASEKSTYEVDFIFSEQNTIVPVEVKSGENVRSKSLQYFCAKFNPKKAYRCSFLQYHESDVITDIPLWAVSAM